MLSAASSSSSTSLGTTGADSSVGVVGYVLSWSLEACAGDLMLALEGRAESRVLTITIRGEMSLGMGGTR